MILIIRMNPYHDFAVVTATQRRSSSRRLGLRDNSRSGMVGRSSSTSSANRKHLSTMIFASSTRMNRYGDGTISKRYQSLSSSHIQNNNNSKNQNNNKIINDNNKKKKATTTKSTIIAPLVKNTISLIAKILKKAFATLGDPVYFLLIHLGIAIIIRVIINETFNNLYFLFL